MQKITLIWFRRNLRLSDNAVLQTAVAHGLPLAAAYVSERPSEIPNPRRAVFHHQAAAELSAALAEKGVPLFAVQGGFAETLPELAKRLNAQRVLADEGCTPSEILQDNRIWRILDTEGIAFDRINDRTVFAKADIMSGHGRPYDDFAPYKQAWLQAFRQQFSDQRPSETAEIPFQTAFADLPPFPSIQEAAYPHAVSGQTGGERAAWRRWRQFLNELDFYPHLKDFPAKKATSQMGAYLAAGCISPRVLAREAAARGADVWLENLIRRDFYCQLAFHRAGLPPAGESPADAEIFRRWTQGETGFPLIDAAMRCLFRSGWLPPVLRQVAAEFWCGFLRQPWQQGAQWFAQNLLDADEALNVGNWQAAAAATRPFAPLLQAQKLDPDGMFVRRYIPELAHLPKEVVHAPWLVVADVDLHGYPLPMWEAV